MAYLFEADDDAVLLGSPSELDNIWSGGGALSFWIRLNSFGIGTNFGRVLDKAATTSTGTGFALQVAGGAANQMRLEIGWSTTEGVWTSPTDSLTTDTWYHFVIFYNSDSTANDAEMWIDGQSVTVTEATAPVGTLAPGTTNPAVIGNFQDLNRTFDGEISDLRLFNVAGVSDAAAATIYASQGISDGKFIQAHWPMYGVLGRSGANLFKQSTTTDNGGLTITSTVPANTTDGDKLILVVASGGTTTTSENITTPAGWSHVNVGQTDLDSTFSRPSVWVFERTASSEPANYVVTGDVDCTKIAHMLCVDALGSVDVSSPINTGTSADPVSPDVTAGGNAYCLRICCMDDDEVQADSVWEFLPPGVNGREVDESTVGAGNGCSLAVADEMVSAGSTGTKTWNPVASEQWGCLTITWDGGAGVEPAAVRDIGPDGINGDIYGKVHIVPDILKRRKRAC